jgi:hypothetical protein
MYVRINIIYIYSYICVYIYIWGVFIQLPTRTHIQEGTTFYLGSASAGSVKEQALGKGIIAGNVTIRQYVWERNMDDMSTPD